MACVGGGVLLGVAFPPADLGPLALVAIAPLLWAWRDATSKRAALYGLLFGIAFFGVLLEWSRYFGAVAIIPLVVGEAAFVAITGAVVAALSRRGMRSPWLTAAVWVVLEGARARVPFGGFPWGEVGVALHDLSPARALASFGGVPLITLLVVAANGYVVDAVLAARAGARRGVVIAVASVVGIIALSGVALVTRFDPRDTGPVRYALLQANDQNRDLTVQEIQDDYLMRRHLDLAAELRGPYDLIVFPESSLERDPTQFDYVREELLSVAQAHDAVVLANARTNTPSGGIANSNLAYRPTGELEGIYSKQRLVPFGEYVPWRDTLSFISELDQVAYDYERGTKRVLFSTAGHDFATLICFESAFSPLARDFVNDGAEFIVVTTNNRSYRRSGLAAQHLALSQMRAAETARPVLHASISGITGVIDPNGDVRDTSELFVNKITSGTIQATTGETPFVRFGDWVLGASMLALLAAAIITRSRRPRDAAVDSDRG